MLEPWTTENKEILPFKERYSLMLSDRKKCPISTLDTSANCILKYNLIGALYEPRKNSKSMAIPDKSIQEPGRTATGRMKQSLKASNLLKYADTHQSKKRANVANPHAFKMTTKGGEVVVARRNKADRSEMDWLYREEKEAKIKKSWDFKIL